MRRMIVVAVVVAHCESSDKTWRDKQVRLLCLLCFAASADETGANVINAADSRTFHLAPVLWPEYRIEFRRLRGSHSRKMRIANLPVSVVAARLLPTRWDLLVVPLLLVAFVILAHGARQMAQPLTALDVTPPTLDPTALPGYALRTTLRMLAALVRSIIFTFTYGTLAAKSRRAGALLVPLLDILQSVPILGFLSFTVTFFLGLFPGNVLRAECAAIFAIFTSQAWNMSFSFYQSLRSVPRDLDEATRSFGLSGWQRFWRLEVPFSIPGVGVEYDDVNVGRLVFRRSE